MIPRPPITHQVLINWAGQRVFNDAKTLSERGLVQDVSYEPPIVSGTISWSNRPLKTAVRLLQDGSAENHCPCRDSKERGIICAHVVALCIELIRRSNDPLAQTKRAEEKRHADRMANYDDGAYIRRARTGEPGSHAAHIQLTLGAGWKPLIDTDRIPLLCSAVVAGHTLPIDAIPKDTCLGLTQKDESVLFVIEDISGGPAQARLDLTRADFGSLLQLLQGHTIHEEGNPQPITITATKLTSFLHLDLDRENGELILLIHTEIPFAKATEPPVYVVTGQHGWAFGAHHFWPLEHVLPEAFRTIYKEPVVVPREAVPRFMTAELPVLSRFMRVESDLSLDLFTIEAATPSFRLAIRGSPASLAATLHARYDGISLVAAKSDPAGHFSVPDPSDLLRYTVRNPEAEKQALAVLSKHGFTGEAGDKLSPIVGCREVLNFLGCSVPTLRRIGWRVELEGRIGGHMETLDFATPVVRISTPPQEGGWFDVGFEFEGGEGRKLSAADVQRALRKGESYLEQDGRTVLLDGDAISAMLQVFQDCSSGEGSEPGVFRMPAVYASYVKAALDALDGVDVEAPPAWRLAAERQSRELAMEPVPLTEAQERLLRPYQKEGVNWLRFLEVNAFGGILADEMGLGKTLQTLVWLQQERYHPVARGKPALIICPTSLVGNWAEEAQRFVPDLNVLAVTGADRHAKWGELPNADLVVTSYALLRRDVAHYLEHEFAALILDEAQHIKNRSTQNAMTAKELKAHHRLVLTGTPIENSVSDLWSIMDFLMPEYLGSHESFRRNCELPMAEGGAEGEAAQLRLKRKLQPFLLRRLKTEVARDLPPRIEKIATCPLSADQRAVYKQLLDASRQKLADLVERQGFQRSRMEVLKTLLRLRQICCHLDLLPHTDTQFEAPSAKMDLFFELLDEALDGGHRVLVFSQFVSMLQILRGQMERRQIPFCYLDGATEDRMAVVHQFNTNRKIPLFLISLKAGGTGLNLTGADMVIHYDPWWNPAVEDQATDRAHRIGQKRTVYSVKLITKDTVEEKVLAMQRRKKAVIDSTLVSGESVFNSMTWTDIQELLTL